MGTEAMEFTQPAGCRRLRGHLGHSSAAIIAAVLAVVVGHFSLANAVFYEMMPHSQECFSLQVPSQDDLIGSFDATPSDTTIDVTVSHEDAQTLARKNVYESRRSRDRNFRVQADHGEGIGKYWICFRSYSTQYATLSFHLKTSSHEADEVATADHTQQLERYIGRIEDRVEEMAYQQEYTATREAVHRNVTEHTHDRVLYWTCGQVGLLVLISFFQIYYVRSLFEVRTIV